MKQRLGNFGVLVRAYTYIETLGDEACAETERDAVLNANYLLALAARRVHVAYDRTPMHEFVLSGGEAEGAGVRRARHREARCSTRLPPADDVLPAASCPGRS